MARKQKRYRAMAEKVLGKSLPPKAQVHHVDLDGTNDEPSNLVICEDDGYHKLLHARLRALKACGDPNKRKCKYCKQWEDLKELVFTPQNIGYYHSECYNKYRRDKHIIWNY